jgi:D-aminoacyl-tRNA deacylase
LWKRHDVGVRALVQRVSEASVTVDGAVVGAIGPGLVAFVGVTHEDDEAAARKLADRIHGLRIFNDEAGVMNLSAADVGAEVLVVSQFTLYGDTSRGRRPSWVQAAKPEQAEPLIEVLVDELKTRGATVATGRFRAHMHVALVNDGPVTVLLST